MGSNTDQKMAVLPSAKDDGEAKARHETRSALLDAAGALMTQLNTVDIPIAQIGKRAGKNAALIKYHFGNKEGLMYALLMRDFEPGLAELKRLANADLTAPEKLRAHITYSVQGMATVPYIYRLLHALLRDSDAEIAKAVTQSITKPVADFYEQIINQGVDEKCFNAVDPMLFYIQVSGALDLFFSARSTWRHGFAVDQSDTDLQQKFAQQLGDTVLQGIMRG